MKINTITSNRLAPKGMTLIEISLVVALLLSLIAILFVGISAYKKGTDRSKCILNIAAAQKAVRSHQNMFEFNPGDTIASTDIIGTGKYIESLSCPASGTYTFSGTIPAVGTAYATCSLETSDEHVPKSTSGW